jgi:SagB-type dehydrogenase family enzyme
MRNVPSGGYRHRSRPTSGSATSSHIAGLYRYLPIEHALVAVDAPSMNPKSSRICYRQTFVDEAAVTFVWTAIPYRTEWRYGPDSLKDILLSCGHICQNLYLACETIGAGTCGILAYDQDELDAFLGVDGNDEISLYVAPVGKRRADCGAPAERAQGRGEMTFSIAVDKRQRSRIRDVLLLGRWPGLQPKAETGATPAGPGQHGVAVLR